MRKLDSTQSAAKKPKASASAAAKHGALHVRGHGHERLSITQPQPMSNSELADLMLIAEGGADTYGTPRGGADGETATTFAFAPIQLMPEHFGVMGVAEGDQEHMQAAASNDVYGGLCHAMSQGYTSPSASAHAHPSDRDSAGATGSAARSGATGGEEGGGGSHAANSSVDVFASIVGSELEEARLAANLGMMYGSSAPSASSSPPRASGCGLDASQPCALTQADVAATVLHDSKLEWSWLSLANLEVCRKRAVQRNIARAEHVPRRASACLFLTPPRKPSRPTCAQEEFVSMRDILQDERPEQQADLLPSAC